MKVAFMSSQPGIASSAWLGVLGLSVTPAVTRAMNLLPDQQGVLVEELEPEGPADRAHMRAGDILVAVNGRPVHRLQDMQYFLRRARPGQRATLTFLRNHEWARTKVILGKRPTLLPSVHRQGKEAITG
jgi:S1-C subfamily serine protease